MNEPVSRKELRKMSSSLWPHNPFIDQDGVIRVGSRLVHAQIKDEAKFPAILPRKDKNVQDLIRQVHGEERHAGAKHVLCQLRQRVWILQGLQEVKGVIGKCVFCQRQYKEACGQKMAVLPPERVMTTAPFASSGVDTSGIHQ